MTHRQSIGRLAACTALLVAVLAACSSQTPESHVASAQRYLASKQYPAAVIELKNALQKSPGMGEARMLLGTALLETGDVPGAAVELRRALKYGVPESRVVPPLARATILLGEAKQAVFEFGGKDLGDAESNAELLAVLGHAHLSLRQPQAAQAAFSKALELRPGLPLALLGNARMKIAENDLPGALRLTDAALQTSPEFFDAHQLRGDLLAAMGKHDEAIAAHRRSLQIKPKDIAANATIVVLHLRQNKLDDAGKQLDALKRIAPKRPVTSFLQANYDYRRKNLASAREAIQQYLNAAPDSVRGLLLASAIEHDLKSYAQSESYLLRVLKASPGLAPARQLLVANYLRNGQPEQAIEALKPLLSESGNDAGMLTLAGEAFLAVNKAPEASRYFAKASQLDPGDPRKLARLGLSRIAEGKGDEGIRDLEKAVEVGPGGGSDVTLIVAHLQRREFDKALKAIDALEKRQPGKALTHNLRGSALLGKGDAQAARKSFEQALALDPAFFPAAANLARLDLADKKPEQARKRFESVLAKDPKSVESLLALAELRGRERAPADEVVALIGKAVSANPTAVKPRVALVNFHLRTNQPGKATAAAQQALAAIPNRAEILDAAGRAYLANGESNQALSTFARWAQLEPKSPMPLIRTAEVQMAGKQFDAAADTLRKALELKPDSLDAQRRSIAVDVRRNRTPLALATARTVQKQRPKEAAGYLLEGEIHANSKDWTPAIAAYRSGLKQADSVQLAIRLHGALRAAKSNEAATFAAERLNKYPNQTAFRVYLAELALATGDYASAVQHYQILLASQPGNAFYLNNLAFAAAREKDPKALEYAEKAVALAPDNPAILDTLGVLLVEQGDATRGVETLRQAASLGPQNPSIRLHLAKGLIKTGQKPAARKELETLAKLGDKFSGHAEVEKLLKEL